MPQIAAIYSRYVREAASSFELEPPDVAEMRERMQAIVSRGLPYLVATPRASDETIAAYAYASTYRPRAGYRYTLEDSVYVRADHQRRGLGRLLLAQVIAASEARGYRQMIAIVGDSANVASIELHAALGFARAGVLTNVGRKLGRWLDTVLMQRALGPGAATPPDEG